MTENKQTQAVPGASEKVTLRAWLGRFGKALFIYGAFAVLFLAKVIHGS